MLNPPGFWQTCACERSPANFLQKISMRRSSFQNLTLHAESLHAEEFIQGVFAEIPHARHPSGAADLIASRIPPGRIDWVVGGKVVFFVFVVFSVFPVFVGLVAFLLCC